MKSLINKDYLSKEHFYKICIIGGGLTGAVMTLLLKNSNLFSSDEIAWIKPKTKNENDVRTTFFNKNNLELLKKFKILDCLKKNDFSYVKKIKVYGTDKDLPLIWDYPSSEENFGAVIQNDIISDSILKKLKDIKQYDSLVTNTTYDHFERTLYLKNKTSIKTNLLLSADGKNSQLRKLLYINTLSKKSGHIAISGFLKQSKNHNEIAMQAFTELGPIGILPYGNKDIINFVLSVEENKYKQIFLKKNPEQYICNKLDNFFSNIDLTFKPIKKINSINNKLSIWPLNLNFVINPTSYRAILIGDAAHSIHPLAGQGLNLSFNDCVSVIKSIEKSMKYGNDLGDKSILNNYKKDRMPQTIAMTAITDFLFYGFTSKSNQIKSLLTSGMVTLNKSNLKNIFRDFASS